MKWFLYLKRIYFKYLRNKISNKLIAVSLVLFLSFAFILTLCYYYFSNKTLKNTFIDYNAKILNVVSNNFESYMNQISQLSLIIRNNEELISKMKSANYSFEVKDQLGLVDYSKIKQLGIYKIEFYIPEANKVFLLDKNNLVLVTQDYSDASWYKELIKRDNFAYIEPLSDFSNNDEKSIIVFRRSIIDILNKDIQLIVNIYIEKDLIENYVKFAKVYDNEELYLFDEAGTLFYSTSTDSGKINEITKNISLSDDLINNNNNQYVTLKDDSYIKVLSKSLTNKWILVKLVNSKYFASNIKKVFSFGLLVITLFTVFIIVIFVIIFKKIASGISKLSKYVDVVGEGDFNAFIENESDDEIGQLTRQFNSMTAKIKELINEKYKLKLSEKNAILKSLEAQINPHFLYNTLQAISGIAIANKQEKISRMLEALAISFRYKINKNTMTTIYEEIEYINTYIQLYRLRFGERINIEYKIDNNTLDLLIPRMLFQILVENSIKYAVETTTKVVTINLTARISEDYLEIEVTDDGIGVTEEKLLEIRRNISDESLVYEGHQGIGLANLSERIKLLFNNKIIFCVESTHMKDFSVNIRINMKELD